MPPQSIAKISTLINTLLNFVSGKNQHPQNANAQKSGKNTIKIIKNIAKSMTKIIFNPLKNFVFFNYKILMIF